MPLYTYKCTNCEDQFDVRQKISEAKLTKCSKCNTESLQKVITTTQAPVLKGGGWTRQSLTR